MGKLASFFTLFKRQDENTLAMQDMNRKMHIAAKRIQRASMHKPAFSMGHRGFPRTMRLGKVAAPTIDQVRKLERAYMCKLIVKDGLLYFRDNDNIPFSHEAGRAYRHAVMSNMVEATN